MYIHSALRRTSDSMSGAPKDERAQERRLLPR